MVCDLHLNKEYNCLKFLRRYLQKEDNVADQASQP